MWCLGKFKKQNLAKEKWSIFVNLQQFEQINQTKGLWNVKLFSGHVKTLRDEPSAVRNPLVTKELPWFRALDSNEVTVSRSKLWQPFRLHCNHISHTFFAAHLKNFNITNRTSKQKRGTNKKKRRKQNWLRQEFCITNNKFEMKNNQTTEITSTISQYNTQSGCSL